MSNYTVAPEKLKQERKHAKKHYPCGGTYGRRFKGGKAHKDFVVPQDARKPHEIDIAIEEIK